MLGEIVGWGGKVTKTSSSAPRAQKMEEYKFSKKILEQEPTPATWKASVEESVSLINRGNPRQNKLLRHQLAAGRWPLTQTQNTLFIEEVLRCSSAPLTMKIKLEDLSQQKKNLNSIETNTHMGQVPHVPKSP